MVKKTKKHNIEKLAYYNLIEHVNKLKKAKWNNGLYAACYAGHLNMIKCLIKKGASDYNIGLYAACLAGHKQIINLMINLGANDWDVGLLGAQRGHHEKIARFMIAKGAIKRNCDFDFARHKTMFMEDDEDRNSVSDEDSDCGYGYADVDKSHEDRAIYSEEDYDSNDETENQFECVQSTKHDSDLMGGYSINIYLRKNQNF